MPCWGLLGCVHETSASSLLRLFFFFLLNQDMSLWEYCPTTELCLSPRTGKMESAPHPRLPYTPGRKLLSAQHECLAKCAEYKMPGITSVFKHKMQQDSVSFGI